MPLIYFGRSKKVAFPGASPPYAVPAHFISGNANALVMTIQNDSRRSTPYGMAGVTMQLTRKAAGEQILKKAMELGSVALALCTLFLLGAASDAAAQTVPVATASASATLATINGNAGHIAANSLGDAFYVSQGSNTAYWLPRGATTPVAILTGLSGGRNVFVDPSNNVYVASTYSGYIVEIPYVNGTYATGTAAGSTSACTSVTPSAPCQQGSAGAALAYYYQPGDVGMDAAGNLYTIDSYPNGQCASGDCVVEFPRGATTYGAAVLVKSNAIPNNTGAQLAVAPNGDIYLANGTQVFYLAAGTSNVVTVGSFTNPVGVSSDKFGDIFVANAAVPYAVTEFPAVNGIAQPSKQFPVLSGYVGNGVGLDNLGDIFYTGYSGGTTLNQAQLNAINVGSAPVGTAVSATATSITFTFGAGGTPAGITSTGKGFTYTAGSCAAGTAYAAGGACTVNVTYTPTAVGLQRGSISLTNAAGASLSTALLSGIGQGAAETNDPGTLTAIGSGFNAPSGVRVDGNGNVYVADAGLNVVQVYAGGTGTPTTIGTGLSKPSSVVVDGAGNAYIADAGNGRVVEVPNINGTLTSSAQTVIASGLGMTLSIALDRFGNLYIADGGRTSITKLGNIGGIPSTSATSTVGSKFTMPFALAVDNTGNLFVADYSTSTVSEITYYGQAQTAVGAGLSKPSGLVTDASGSLYIADSGNSRLIKLPYENGAFNTNDQYLVGSTVAVPYGVGIDASGNLYVTDVANKTVSMINRTAGTLALGRAQINTTTAASNGYIGSAGNQSLVLGTPDFVATTTTPAYFTVTPPANKGCANAATLVTGSSCLISATFAPTTTGTFNDLLTFTSNAANAQPQTLNITGRGLNLASSTVTLTQTAPSGAAAFGSSITIQAAIASAVAGTPTGTVTFSVDGNQLTNPPTVNNGVASVVLTGLTGGPHTVTATYSGDNNYAPSNGSLAITVAKAPSVTTFAFGGTVNQAPLSAAPGAAVTLTATVVPAASTAPTGGVTFMVGSTVLNATPIPLTPSSAGYVAILTTTALPVGTDAVTATYSGDVNYASSSFSAGILVTYPDFTVSPAMSSLTIAAGSSGAVPLTFTSVAGFASLGATVGASCTGLPANSSCSINPNAFPLVQGAPQTVALQILTGQTPIVPQPVTGGVGSGGSPMQTALLALLALLAPMTLVARRKVTRGLSKQLLAGVALLMAGLGVASVTGCGGGSGFVGVTPKGTFTITVSTSATATIPAYTSATVPTVAAGCKVATVVGPYSTAYTETCPQVATISLVVQ